MAAAQLRRATTVAAQWMAKRRRNRDGTHYERRQWQWETAMAATQPQWAMAAEVKWMVGQRRDCYVQHRNGNGQLQRDGNLMGDGDGDVITMVKLAATQGSCMCN